MPRIKLKLLGSLTPWTRTPNLVIDKLLPTLKDSELRVLMVILRATVGWNRADSSVCLTYRVLQAKTGRSSEAISKALTSLDRQGFIHITRSKTQNFLQNAKKLASESEGDK